MTATEIVLAITTIASVAVPSICTLISSHLNNKSCEKLEKMKQYDAQRITALNDFIKKSHAYFSCISTSEHSQEDFHYYHSEMIHSFLALQLYFELDDATRERMFKMERMGGYDKDWEFRNQLVVSLSNQINKYLK